MSEAASPQPWDQEHSIDLGAVEAPAPARLPDPSPPGRRLYVPNIVLAYAAVAIALAAAVVTTVKWSPFDRPAAESAVLAFLEAVRDGDVEGALSHTNQEDIAPGAADSTGAPDPSAGADSPDGAGSSDETDPSDSEGSLGTPGGGPTQGRFLVPEALDPRWEIVMVEQVGYSDNADEDRATAQIYAEIEAHDGTRVGHRYQVALEHGRAELLNAVPKVEAWGAFEYLDINGVRLEVDPNTGYAYVYILPGLYEYYPDLPPTLGIDEGSILVLGDAFLTLGGETADDWMPVPYPSITGTGEDAVNAALREHYDACAAEPAGEGCPFAFPEDPERELAPAPGAVWEIAVYPQVSTEQFWYNPGLGYGLQTAMPGEARVLARIIEDGRERTALVSCPIWVDGLHAKLDAEGGATVGDHTEMAPDRCRSLIETE